MYWSVRARGRSGGPELPVWAFAGSSADTVFAPQWKSPMTTAKQNCKTQAPTKPVGGSNSQAEPERSVRRKASATAVPSPAEPALKPGTKAAAILKLLSRNNGATIEELGKATGWQVHSVRGFLSGTLKKKLGIAILSEKDGDERRRYRIAS